MPRIAVGVEYDGSAFAGWQTQRELATVQDALEAALSRVANAPVEVVGAGRTDTGVHSRGQVAHFDVEAERSTRSWVLGANTYLPSTIALRWAKVVPDHFHARYSALWRSYRYCIVNRFARPAIAATRASFIYRPLEIAPMQEAARALVGEHDFSAFRAAECQAKSPMRTISELRLERRGEFIVMQVRANAFLQHMVRNIAGTLIWVGQGAQPPSWAAEVLRSRDRKLNAATAAAAGLYFWQVGYPPVFELPDDSDMMQSPTGCRPTYSIKRVSNVLV